MEENMKVITKESTKGAVPKNDRSGNLEFCSAVINGTEYIYFRIGKNVARSAGLRRGDKVVILWDDNTARCRIEPRADGWALQSGNMKAEEPPLTLRVTRKLDDMYPRLEKIGKCREVKAVGNTLEFLFPLGTVFTNDPLKPKEEDKTDLLFQEHKDLIEGKKRPATRCSEPNGGSLIRYKDGKIYGRRSTDV